MMGGLINLRDLAAEFTYGALSTRGGGSTTGTMSLTRGGGGSSRHYRNHHHYQQNYHHYHNQQLFNTSSNLFTPSDSASLLDATGNKDSDGSFGIESHMVMEK